MFGYNIYFNYVEPHLPRRLHRGLRSAWRKFHKPQPIASNASEVLQDRAGDTFGRLGSKLFMLRVKALPTRILGPRWRRKGNIAEIDITYSCNLKCYNCNRSCEQDPSNDGMSVAQVRQFLEETRTQNRQWRHIRLLGGEPTTHPHFLEILNLVLEWRNACSPDTRLILVTNGHGERVNRILALVPAGVEIENSAKTTKVQTAFSTFNVAPRDLKEYQGTDFSNACSAVSVCGMGVTPYGYYPCAVAGAIDRTFGLNLGRKEMPKPGDGMKDELRQFCSLCGLFKPPTGEPLNGPVMSPTWVKAYAQSRANPPKLSRLPEAPQLVQITAEKHETVAAGSGPIS